MRVLFLTHRLPYAPNRGDRIRANYLLRALGRSAEVHLASLVHSPEEAHEGRAVRSLVASLTVGSVPTWRNRLRAFRALATGEPLTHVLLDSPELRNELRWLIARCRPDVVLAFCSSMARYALEPCLSGIPFVLDMVDLDSSKWRTLAGRSTGWRAAVYAREARTLLAFEREAAKMASATIVVNGREREELRDAGIDGNVFVVPNGIDAEYLAPPYPPATIPRVIFSGVMDYFPNVDAACWMAREIWPLVRRRMPLAQLVLMGARPARAVEQLASPHSGISVTGSVVDQRPYFWGSAVAVAPLRIARGLQNKVVEAVAAGLPVVATTVVGDGIPHVVRPACRFVDGAQEFADAVVELLRTSAEKRRSVASSVDLSTFEFQRTLAPVADLLKDACEQRRLAA